MTETTASSRVIRQNQTGLGNGGGGGRSGDGKSSGGNGSGSHGSDGNGSARGGARYTEADLEPIRARLAEFARGDFCSCAETAGEHEAVTTADPLLGEILQLADDVGGQLASVTSEAAQTAAQVRDIALITTAVARGDLTGKVTVEATGEMLQLKQTVNMLVDQLSAFADEVTRV